MVSPLRGGFVGDWIIPLPNARSGFAILGSIPNPALGSPLFQVRLFRIDSDLNCHELANWLARDFTVFAKFHNVKFTDTHVVSLATGTQEVEFRDNETGELVGAVPIPVPEVNSPPMWDAYHFWPKHLRYNIPCLLYTSPSPRDATLSRMPSSA